jgi:hypothetical protein
MRILWEMWVKIWGQNVEGPGIEKNNVLFMPPGMTETKKMGTR